MHFSHNKVDLNHSKAAAVRLLDSLTEIKSTRAATEEIYLLLAETASKAKGKWLACFKVIFAGRIQPPFRLERVWIMKVIFVMSYGPSTRINFGLFELSRSASALKNV